MKISLLVFFNNQFIMKNNLPFGRKSTPRTLPWCIGILRTPLARYSRSWTLHVVTPINGNRIYIRKRVFSCARWSVQENDRKENWKWYFFSAVHICTIVHVNVIAEATFVHSTLKNILTRSCWYSLDSSRCVQPAGIARGRKSTLRWVPMYQGFLIFSAVY